MLTPHPSPSSSPSIPSWQVIGRTLPLQFQLSIFKVYSINNLICQQTHFGRGGENSDVRATNGTPGGCPFVSNINTLNAELNRIRHLLALVGARHFVHFSRIRVNVNKTRDLLTMDINFVLFSATTRCSLTEWRTHFAGTSRFNLQG